MRSVARVISLVFHPVFLFVYIVIALMLINPYMFGFNNIYDGRDLLLLITLTVIPIPILTVLMLKGLGWAETIYLRKREERIAPFLITGLLYLTLYLQLAKTNSAIALQITALAGVITLFGAFFFNNFFKISLHAAGGGALISMMVLTILFFSGDTFSLRIHDYYIAEMATVAVLYVSIVLTGLLCTSRLILKQHTSSEIYSGLILGFFAPLLAYYIVV